MYSYILFDLDGTLTEPYEGIKNSILYALDRLSFKVDESKLKSFIGPPLYKSFMEQCGMSESTAEKAIALYREYFSARGLYENRVYDGIEEVLQSLKETGKHLIVATSKPQVFAEKILAHFNLKRYFEGVSAATLDNSRVEKADIIAHALKSFGISAADAIMVGDRSHDVCGAKANGLKSIGVLYGYGDSGELISAGADRLAALPGDIISCVQELDGI